MFDWYKGMIDENTGRLLYLSDPQSDVRIGDGEPIRASNRTVFRLVSGGRPWQEG